MIRRFAWGLWAGLLAVVSPVWADDDLLYQPLQPTSEQTLFVMTKANMPTDAKFEWEVKRGTEIVGDFIPNGAWGRIDNPEPGTYTFRLLVTQKVDIGKKDAKPEVHSREVIVSKSVGTEPDNAGPNNNLNKSDGPSTPTDSEAAVSARIAKLVGETLFRSGVPRIDDHFEQSADNFGLRVKSLLTNYQKETDAAKIRAGLRKAHNEFLTKVEGLGAQNAWRAFMQEVSNFTTDFGLDEDKPDDLRLFLTAVNAGVTENIKERRQEFLEQIAAELVSRGFTISPSSGSTGGSGSARPRFRIFHHRR